VLSFEMREVRRAAQVPLAGGMVAAWAGHWVLAVGLAVVGLLAATIVALYGVRRASPTLQALDRADGSRPASRRSSPGAIPPST
jgi:hypothetical protein